MTWSALLLPLLFCTAAIFLRRASGVCIPDGPCACLERGSNGAKCLSQSHCLGGLLCAEERCHVLPEKLGDPCTRDSQCSSAIDNSVCGGRVASGVGVCQCGAQFRDYYLDGRCFSRGATLPTDGASEDVPSCTSDMNRTRWDILLREHRGDIIYVRVSDEEPLVLFAFVTRDTQARLTYVKFAGAELWNYETQQLVQKIAAYGWFVHDMLFVHKTHVLTISQQAQPESNGATGRRNDDTFTITRRSISNREPTIVWRIFANYRTGLGPVRPSAAVHPNEPLVALSSAYAAIQVYDTNTFQLLGTYGAATTLYRRVVRWDPFASNKLFVANPVSRPVIQLYVLNLSGNTFTTEAFTGRRSITHEMTHDLTDPLAIKAVRRNNPAVTHAGVGWILQSYKFDWTLLRITLDNGDGTTTLIEPERPADVGPIYAIGVSPRRRVIAVAAEGGMMVYRYPFCKP